MRCKETTMAVVFRGGSSDKGPILLLPHISTPQYTIRAVPDHNIMMSEVEIGTHWGSPTNGSFFISQPAPGTVGRVLIDFENLMPILQLPK